MGMDEHPIGCMSRAVECKTITCKCIYSKKSLRKYREINYYTFIYGLVGLNKNVIF